MLHSVTTIKKYFKIMKGILTATCYGTVMHSLLSRLREDEEGGDGSLHASDYALVIIFGEGSAMVLTHNPVLGSGIFFLADVMAAMADLLKIWRHK